jgi:hypothetical protein
MTIVKFSANTLLTTKQLLIGFAYDYTLTKLGDYNKGSYEVILGYDFNFEKKRVITPRYF